MVDVTEWLNVAVVPVFISNHSQPLVEAISVTSDSVKDFLSCSVDVKVFDWTACFGTRGATVYCEQYKQR